jgi:hypothetical protein
MPRWNQRGRYRQSQIVDMDAGNSGTDFGGIPFRINGID